MSDDVADVNYWARITTDDEYPLFRAEIAVSKEPAFAEVGTPTVSGDTLTSLPITYGWRGDTYNRDATGAEDTNTFYSTLTEYASPSQIVDYADSLIGTAWEGATCAALLDAGFIEPCQIPPLELPDVEVAPNPVVTCRKGDSTNWNTNTAFLSDVTLANCALELLEYWEGVFPSLSNWRLARTTCSGTTTKTFTIYGRYNTTETSMMIIGQARWNNDPACFNAYIEDPLSSHVQGDFDPYNPDGEEPEPVESDISDAELAFDLYEQGLITSNYLIDQSTGKFTYFSSVSGRVPTDISEDVFNSVFVPGVGSTSTVPVDAPVVEVYSYAWTGFTYGSGGGGPTPTPSPDPDPSPSPGGSGFDCEANPGTLACANADLFAQDLADAISDGLTDDLELPDGDAAAEEVGDAISDALQGVGDGGGDLSFDGDIFSGVSGISGLLPSAGSCEVFVYELHPTLGMEFSLDTCRLTPVRSILEWFLYAMTIFVLYRIAIGSRGET